jgi:hypothetical protein
VGWVQEKTSAMYAEGYGHDLESIQALIRKHQGYARDLEALKQQVSLLSFTCNVGLVNKQASTKENIFPVSY